MARNTLPSGLDLRLEADAAFHSGHACTQVTTTTITSERTVHVRAVMMTKVELGLSLHRDEERDGEH